VNLGPWEILIIAVVIVLLFGARKMPAMARSLGQSMRILKAETKGMKEDDADAAPSQPPAQQPQQLPQAQVSTPKVSPPGEQTQANKNAS
jgi:sec-independent protein translocase protein TatA